MGQNFNPTIITATIAIVALISPAITTIINNRHQRMIKELEMKQENFQTQYKHKEQLFEKLLETAAEFKNTEHPVDKGDFRKLYHQSLIHIPKHQESSFENCCELILNGKTNNGEINWLAQITKEILKEEIERPLILNKKNTNYFQALKPSFQCWKPKQQSTQSKQK